MTRRQRRLLLIGAAGAVLVSAVALGVSAFRDSMKFFVSPSEMAEKHIAAGTRVRLGGIVKAGSLTHGALPVRFVVTDGNSEVAVSYAGIVPDLLNDGQGVVVDGAMDASGVFEADTVLAKHDEKYMPREVADALKKQGRWKGGSE
jgi:cytochrome c-type biogenesis protein CcmE